jgi:hypothetical protein
VFHLIRYPVLSELAVAVFVDHQPGAAFQPFAERLQADEFEQGAGQSGFLVLTTDGEPVSVPLVLTTWSVDRVATPIRSAGLTIASRHFGVSLLSSMTQPWSPYPSVTPSRMTSVCWTCSSSWL